jgi:gas vesicle protein
LSEQATAIETRLRRQARRGAVIKEIRSSNMARIDMKEAAGCLVVGAMVGAAIALLYAPQSGVRTKKDIKRFARKTVDQLEALQGDVRDQVTDWVDDMTDIVKDGVIKVRNSAQKATNKFCSASIA